VNKGSLHEQDFPLANSLHLPALAEVRAALTKATEEPIIREFPARPGSSGPQSVLLNHARLVLRDGSDRRSDTCADSALCRESVWGFTWLDEDG
jgi:hypothetical protein